MTTSRESYREHLLKAKKLAEFAKELGIDKHIYKELEIILSSNRPKSRGVIMAGAEGVVAQFKRHMDPEIIATALGVAILTRIVKPESRIWIELPAAIISFILGFADSIPGLKSIEPLAMMAIRHKSLLLSLGVILTVLSVIDYIFHSKEFSFGMTRIFAEEGLVGGIKKAISNVGDTLKKALGIEEKVVFKEEVTLKPTEKEEYRVVTVEKVPEKEKSIIYGFESIEELE